MSKRAPKVMRVEEDVLRTIAKILGPSSAAQLALDDAKARRERGQAVTFCRSHDTIFVIGEPPSQGQS